MVHNYFRLMLSLHLAHYAFGGLPLVLVANVRLSDFPAASSASGDALSVESFRVIAGNNPS